MKFGQIIEYNMKNHTQNVVEKLVLDTFLKNQNWIYLKINSLKFFSLFLLFVQVEGYGIYWN